MSNRVESFFLKWLPISIYIVGAISIASCVTGILIVLMGVS